MMLKLRLHERDTLSRPATLAAMTNPHTPPCEVEIRGLSIYTHHGVSDAEQEVGQRLEFDLTFDVPESDAVLTDRVEDTVDYSEVCDIVALAATERSYRTLERLCHVVAERLMERFDCDRSRCARRSPSRPSRIRFRRRAWRSPWSAPWTASPTTRTASDRGEPRWLSRARLERRRAGVPAAWGDRRSAAHGVEVDAVSSLYDTEPVGEILDQPDFLNAAIRIRTSLEPSSCSTSARQ